MKNLPVCAFRPFTLFLFVSCQGAAGNNPVGHGTYPASQNGKPLGTLWRTADADGWNRLNNDVIGINDDNADDDQNFRVFGQSTINGKLKKAVIENQNWKNSPEARKRLLNIFLEIFLVFCRSSHFLFLLLSLFQDTVSDYLAGCDEYHASEAGQRLETLPSTAYADVFSQQNDVNDIDVNAHDPNLLMFGQSTRNGKFKKVVEDRNWEKYLVGSSSFRASEAVESLESLPTTGYADVWSKQNDVNGINDGADENQNLLVIGQGTVIIDDGNWEKYLAGSSSFDPNSAEKVWENLNITEENRAYDDGNIWDDDDDDEDDGDYEDYGDYAFDDDGFDNYFNYDQSEKFDHLDFPAGVEATFPWWHKLTSDKGSVCSNSVEMGEIDDKFKEFKQFDSVQDFSDHHFLKLGSEAATFVAKEVTSLMITSPFSSTIHHIFSLLIAWHV